jgi:hypothetical protein
MNLMLLRGLYANGRKNGNRTFRTYIIVRLVRINRDDGISIFFR